MRLTDFEQKAIKRLFKEIFGGGEIYLFGSRVDDSKRGGDIDLFIIPSKKLPFSKLFDKKIIFLRKLQDEIGEQKIDIIISKDKNRSIEQEALKNGIKL